MSFQAASASCSCLSKNSIKLANLFRIPHMRDCSRTRASCFTSFYILILESLTVAFRFDAPINNRVTRNIIRDVQDHSTNYHHQLVHSKLQYFLLIPRKY